MLICKECRYFHPVSVSDRYCGDCCIGDTKNAIAINADITGCCLFEPKQPKPQKRMTNGDRIRQMTDEELAEMLLLSTCYFGCNKCKYHSNCIGKNCTQAALEWLKQEVSEDAGSIHAE